MGGHDVKPFAGPVAFGACIQIVLRRQRVARVGAAQADAADAPGRVVVQQWLCIGSEMGAGEGADAQVDDAGAQGGGIEIRTPYFLAARR